MMANFNRSKIPAIALGGVFLLGVSGCDMAAERQTGINDCARPSEHGAKLNAAGSSDVIRNPDVLVSRAGRMVVTLHERTEQAGGNLEIPAVGEEAKKADYKLYKLTVDEDGLHIAVPSDDYFVYQGIEFNSKDGRTPDIGVGAVVCRENVTLHPNQVYARLEELVQRTDPEAAAAP